MNTYLLPVKQIKCNIINSFIPICTENAFATVCEYMGIEYQYAFAYATNLQFSADFCDAGRVADGIFTSYNFIKSFEEVYHMEIIQRQFTFFKSYIKYIDQKLASNIPVIAHFDSYYIPWSTLYHVRHTSHLVIVIGLDTDSKQLTILDPIDCDKPVNITYRQFKSGSHFCLELEQPKNPCTISHDKFVADLIASPDMLIPAEMFQSLHALATCITDIFDPYVEFEDCYNHSLILEEKLIDDIRKIMQGINMFTVWLQWFYSENKMYSLDIVIEEFKSILSKWNVLLNMLYKRSLTTWEEDFKYKFAQFLDNIATMHEAAYSDFINCLKTKEDKTLNTYVTNTYITQSFSNSTPIDLRKYFNNKGFTLANNPIAECDLTGAGEYFCIDSSHSDNIFSVKDIDFRIEYNSNYDNIICNSQQIDGLRKFTFGNDKTDFASDIQIKY